jgi:hypothetical protein
MWLRRFLYDHLYLNANSTSLKEVVLGAALLNLLVGSCIGSTLVIQLITAKQITRTIGDYIFVLVSGFWTCFILFFKLNPIPNKGQIFLIALALITLTVGITMLPRWDGFVFAPLLAIFGMILLSFRKRED